ncbi:MAG: tripartite tricarboxylate transporter TctB family protein [Desulfovibrio sp.]|uniref:tripartite tricarboxylate transporter TctB family protein n=1 Tax=Desulfovibrio sp. TaxID=885 RepID=UPI00258D057A|nr:tripartite tricarboxylate transporter TctB family protein [Desulfovibrio sp.]MCD7982894.1 tripartite tricarboxylate transporter TctB family protein [Desulfovibrio sp.]
MPELLKRNIWIEFGLSLFCVLFFAFLYFNIEHWVLATMPSTLSPAFFPMLITAICLVMSALLLFFSLRSLYHMHAGLVDDERILLQEAGEEAGRFLALAGYVGVLFLYLLGLQYVGFLYSTPIVMLLISLMLGLKRWLTGLVFYILFTLLLDYVAMHLMQIILPQGILFE